MSALLAGATLFAGKITIINETPDTKVKVDFVKYQNSPVSGSLAWHKAPQGPQGLTVAPGTTETYSSKENYGFHKFNFYALSGSKNFKVIGSFGEQYVASKPADDKSGNKLYSDIDVPEITSGWTLWIKPA